MFTKNIVKALLITSTLAGIPAFAADNTCSVGASSAGSTQVKLSEKCSMQSFHRRGEFGKKLGLTDDQLVKMSSIKDQFKISSATQKAEVRATSDQLKNVLTEPQIDKTQALSLQSKLNDLENKLNNEKLQFRIDFMSVLTPEQKGIIRHKELVSEVFGGEHHIGMRRHGQFEHARSEHRPA